VVDSVAALVPRAEVEGEMGDSFMGLQARLMSQAMRKLTSALKTSDTSIIFTNQIRDKIGVSWGSPETTTGGNALKFYATVRLNLRCAEQVKEKDEVVASKIKVTVKKNKVSAPFKVTEYEVNYLEGISRLGEIIDLAVTLGLIDKAGAGWYTIEGRKIQGSAALKDILKEDLTLALSLENKIREHYGLPIKVIE
jgi:recombination protein RecA